MQTKTGSDAPLQPLPLHVQERIWEFVRRQIQNREHATGEKIAKFELHLTDRGQIEVEVLSIDTEEPEDVNARSEGKVNRMKQREELQTERGSTK